MLSRNRVDLKDEGVMGEGEFITILCAGGGSERERNRPASAVVTHPDVASPASRQAGLLLGRSTHCVKHASHPS